MIKKRKANKMNKKNIVEKLKSPVVWISAGGVILTLLLELKVIDLGQMDAFKHFIEGVCGILITFGILNNPNNKNGF